eukprot:TRINITY_DN22512_c0_g1_i1.p1 TRINITY_DN22512_c0_g1~~TRINITY_DN22512_c0_g1_i1.p1  ORF type:complete len:488 (+),score=149.04 TRINITY_DN22512_c0_g1_i1:52-1515(+)
MPGDAAGSPQGSPREGLHAQLVHLFKRVEYTNYEVANLQCRRLARRCLMILGEVERSKEVVGYGLQTILAAGLFVLHECLAEEGQSFRTQKLLINFAYTHVTRRFYASLRRVWASRPLTWEQEDEEDCGGDIAEALTALSDVDAWREFEGAGDVWRLLRALPEGGVEGKRAVTAKFKRHQACFDFADMANSKLHSENRFTTLHVADYRGTRVFIKEVHRKKLHIDDPQNCMMYGSALVPLHHPYIVPMVGCAVTKLGPEGTPSVCAAYATMFASGQSLEQLWCHQGAFPTNAQLLKIARQAAEALLYTHLVSGEDLSQIYLPCLPLDNCIIDHHTGNLRILPQMAIAAKLPSRFDVPVQAQHRACYMVGLLLWCAVSASLPVPSITENSAIRNVMEHSTWAPSPPAHAPHLIAQIIKRACSFQSESGPGYRRLEDVLYGIDAALDDMSKQELNAQCTPEAKPVPVVDLYGTGDPAPLPNPIKPPPET